MPSDIAHEPFVPLVITMNAQIEARKELEGDTPDNISSFDLQSAAALRAVLSSEDTW